MKEFDIHPLNRSMEQLVVNKINNLTKPKGSLGVLEDLALQICLIQQTTSPSLDVPQNILFAADHGILQEGISVTPKEVTRQQVLHYLKGGAGINFLCHQHGFKLKVVDAGVDTDFPEKCGVIDRKIGYGTHNFLYQAAMSEEEFDRCITAGADIVMDCVKEGSNILSFGEMGAGNTSSASVWMHLLTGIPLERCVGAGSGLSPEGIRHKLHVLETAVNRFENNGNTERILQYFGGFELVMAIGAMLQAAAAHIIILVDGFLMTACLLAASKLYPAVKDYAIFGHQGDEGGHKLLLNYLEARPLLHLNLRLGEGTGAVCAFPIVDSAVRMLNEMDSFQKTHVTKYF